MFNKSKIVYKRLNDNVVLCIHKYKKNTGKYHSLIVHYEDTNKDVELGRLNVKSKVYNLSHWESYFFNNNYVVIYKYDGEKFALSNMFDINKRQDIMTNDEWTNFFNYMDISDDIEKNKLKYKRLGSNFKKTVK